MIEGAIGPDSNTDASQQFGGEGRLSDSTGVNALRIGMALAFLATLFVSCKLWLSARDYPHTPVWNGLPQPPHPFDYILYWGMAAALLGTAFLPNPRGALKVVCAIGIFWAILDQSRWQPYVILYMAILASLFAVPFERRRRWSTAEIDWALLPARLAVAFAYLYSGLHKLNHQFVTEVFPWMIGPLHKMIHVDVNRLHGGWEIALALSVAAGEAAAGFLLLFLKTRRLAALFLVTMHGFILLMIGPFGYKWNVVVWPWNIAMPIALWALFWRRNAGSWPAPNLLSTRWWSVARTRSPLILPTVVFCFGTLPILSFFGWWDSYLSFSLYSGSVCQCDIQIDPEDYERMPPAAQAATDPDSGAVDQISWSMMELGAMPYPEHRIALSVGRSLARYARHGPVIVQLRDQPNVMTGKRKYRYVRFPPGGGGPPRRSATNESAMPH